MTDLLPQAPAAAAAAAGMRTEVLLMTAQVVAAAAVTQVVAVVEVVVRMTLLAVGPEGPAVRPVSLAAAADRDRTLLQAIMAGTRVSREEVPTAAW